MPKGIRRQQVGSDFGSEGCGFESSRPRGNSSLTWGCDRCQIVCLAGVFRDRCPVPNSAPHNL